MASSEAKEKQRVRMKTWRASNKDRIAEYQKEWRTRNAAQVAEYQKVYQEGYQSREDVQFRTWMRNLHRNYGLTPECFNNLWQEQSGMCGICGVKLLPKGRESNSACVDHNHQTGAVRGLLCRGCNHGIGNLKDSPEVLRKAAQYLEERGNYSSKLAKRVNHEQ